MKKVLIVAYAFPPVGGAGVQRPAKFVKYLREFGWEPIVVTAANPSVPIMDHSLEKDVPEDIRVYRAKTLEPSYAKKQALSKSDSGVFARLKRKVAAVMLPDLQVLWWPGLALGMCRALLLERPQCIFVTAPPFSAFVPVVILGKLFRTPVILDFRDEWSFSRLHLENAVRSGFAIKLDRCLESFVLRNCNQVTAANGSYVRNFHALYPQLEKSKGVVITNGYDEDDFTAVHPKEPKHGAVVMAYSGTVWKATSLENFMCGLRRFSQEYPALQELLQVKVFGRYAGEEYRHDVGSAPNGLFEVHGYLEHSKVVQELMCADVLLLTLSSLPGSDSIIAGKMFEYMATGNHIFAIIPEGEMSRILLREYKNCTVVDPDDIDGIVAGLKHVVGNIDLVRLAPCGGVETFARRGLTRRLADVFDVVAYGATTPSLAYTAPHNLV